MSVFADRAALPQLRVTGQRARPMKPTMTKTDIEPGSSKLLAGLRVLDFSAVVAGPYCARMMADQGADVIKVEPPEGDLLRNAQPLRDGHSAFFGHVNAGKRAICLDLKKTAGRDLALTLAAQSDVVIENFRPGVMSRLGLDYETVRAVKPDVVYCSISGYGQTGPDAERAAFAPIIHAQCGLDMAQFRYQGTGDRPPRGADLICGCARCDQRFRCDQRGIVRP